MDQLKFDVPGGEVVDEARNAVVPWMAFFTRLRNGIVWRSQADTTARRPTTGVEVGTPYFDTTLGIPIWAKTVPGSGAAITWVRYDGAAV